MMTLTRRRDDLARKAILAEAVAAFRFGVGRSLCQELTFCRDSDTRIDVRCNDYAGKSATTTSYRYQSQV